MKRLLQLSLLLFFPTLLCADDLAVRVTDFPSAYQDVIVSINNNEYQKGFKKLQRLKVNKKTDPNYFYFKGLLLRRLKQCTKAESALKNSLKLKGSKSDVIAELGFCYLERKQYDKAEVAFNEALWFNNMTHHQKGELLFHMGEVYQERGKKDKAATFYHSALKDGSTEAAIKLAEIAIANNDKKQAISLLKNALEKEPDDNTIRIKYAEYLTHNVNPVTNPDAIKHAYEVISPILKNDNLSNAELKVCVKVLSLNGKNEEAARLVKKAAERSPKNPTLQRLTMQLEAEEEAKSVQVYEEKKSFKSTSKKKGKGKRKKRR